MYLKKISRPSMLNSGVYYISLSPPFQLFQTQSFIGCVHTYTHNVETQDILILKDMCFLIWDPNIIGILTLIKNLFFNSIRSDSMSLKLFIHWFKMKQVNVFLISFLGVVVGWGFPIFSVALVKGIKVEQSILRKKEKRNVPK